MALSDIPTFIQENYEIHEWRNASAIMRREFPEEWNDIMEVLSGFRLYKSHISVGGGNKSKVSSLIDSGFTAKGWKETKFDTTIKVEQFTVKQRGRNQILIPVTQFELRSPTHQVDEYKNKIAVEMEWNNKDPFYDRDLNNFRLLFDLRVIQVGVIITRTDELQAIFKSLGRADSYGENTTHMRKLLPRVEGGSGGGCPVLVFGIKRNLYIEDV